MKRYIVYSAERVMYPGDDVDPPEYGHKVVELQADNKRDALMLGVAAMPDVVRENREDGLPPWAGVKVEEVCNDPRHDDEDFDGPCENCVVVEAAKPANEVSGSNEVSE